MTAKEVRQLRKKLKLTREQMAPLVGVTAGSIQNWEKGVNRPKAIYVEKMQGLIKQEVAA